MDKAIRPRRKPNIISRQDEERLLCNTENGDIKVLNSTGALMWDLCDGEHAMGDILDEITKKFKVKKEVAETDLKEFLEALEKLNFINMGG